MTNKEIDTIIKEVLGYKVAWEDNPQGWSEFASVHFTRDGRVFPGTPEEITYTAEQNKFISTAAMLQTIDEIRKRLEKLKKVV